MTSLPWNLGFTSFLPLPSTSSCLLTGLGERDHAEITQERPLGQSVAQSASQMTHTQAG